VAGLTPEMEEALEIIAKDKRGAQCFARKAIKTGGGVVVFLEEIERLEREGEHPGRNATARQINKLFGMDLKGGQIGEHLLHNCSCKDQRDY